MVSDAELVGRLREFLRASDLNTTTAATIRRRLQEDFGVDLTERKSFIREQIDVFISELENENKGGNDENDEEAEGSEAGDGEEGNGKEEEEEEEEEEDESDGGDEEKSTGKGRKRGSNKQNKPVKRTGGGFTKLCSLSPELQKFVGVSELPRTGVVKQLWAYIRENNLQDPSNKRKIMCDEMLENLFNVKTIDMFQMNKVLTKHIWPLNSEGPANSVQKEKVVKKEREDESPKEGKRKKSVTSDETQREDKKRKSATSGIHAPIQLSDALVKFIGTGENALPRSDVVKKIWEYIKHNNLQDPADKRNIICDDRLKELLQVDSFTGFTVAKLLAAHFIKSE